MNTLAVLTPPSGEPVSIQELKDFLRINTTDEDNLLLGFIATAREQFEFRTGRPVLATTYRQFLTDLHPTATQRYRPYSLSGSPYSYRPYCAGGDDAITLVRGGVTSVTAVRYYDALGVLTVASGYLTDLTGTPARVWWTTTWPTTSTTIRPVAHVDFVAGWSVPPASVVTAIRLLAGHYYEQRSDTVAQSTSASLATVPNGFAAICQQYRTGLQGVYGEGF